jgi:hypothetical protein
MPAQEFPQFRKYKSGTSYFRFDNTDEFEELRLLGSKWLIEKYTARILPDRHLVRDLLYDFKAFAEEISEAEYLAVRKQAE